jgi:hypothetical protein
MRAIAAVVLSLCVLLAACTDSKPATKPAASAASGGSTANGGNKIKPPALMPAVKQLVLIYTGDTLSAMQPQVGQTPEGKGARLGGLSALTAALLNYESSITAMARQRVLDSGGDAKNVKTDAERGILGEHPYLLLDYGGWERISDPAGEPYVALQLQMYDYLRYSAVASLLHLNFTPELGKEYKPHAKFKLLCSAGADEPMAMPRVPILVREAHGARWGMVAVPLPPEKAADQAELFAQYIDDAAAQLVKNKCDFGILLCKGAPKKVYAALADDQRFTVVIGASPPAMAAPQGFSEIKAGHPVMLPQLNWGGQEFGTCHLIYTAKGNKPVQFNFVRHAAVDDLKSPLPYRKQVVTAIVERKKLGGK